MITLQQVVDKVREVAKERPEFVYRDQPGAGADECSYTSAGIDTDEGEGCLIGQALMRCGLSRETLAQLQDGKAVGISDFLPVLVGHVEQESNRNTTRDPRVRWLLAAQNAQDTGSSWADAVAQADGAAPGV